MRTGRAIIISARRALGLAAAIAAVSGAAPSASAPASAAQVRPVPVSPHLLYHG
jgi:hypothetical protein